jgi:RND superfamily putative drug exporter
MTVFYYRIRRRAFRWRRLVGGRWLGDLMPAVPGVVVVPEGEAEVLSMSGTGSRKVRGLPGECR